eukprot:1160006-Pelagomonas_calceolata.AAC.1
MAGAASAMYKLHICTSASGRTGFVNFSASLATLPSLVFSVLVSLQVLEKFDIPFPVSALEVNIEPFCFDQNYKSLLHKI